MDIKELYITDEDGGYNSDFWSVDKIIKLNENFIAVASGLGEGQPGILGGIGISGGVGLTGITGITGATGFTGLTGSAGLNIWERTGNTINTNLKQRLLDSCVILGFDTNATPSIIQTSTFVEGGGAIKPASLRVHAVDQLDKVYASTTLAANWDVSDDIVITIVTPTTLTAWPSSGYISIIAGGLQDTVRYSSIIVNSSNATYSDLSVAVDTTFNPNAYTIGSVVSADLLNQRNHIELGSSDGGYGFINYHNVEKDTILINGNTELELKASNFDISGSLFLTDNGTVIPNNVSYGVLVGMSAYGGASTTNTIKGDVIVSDMANAFLPSTLTAAFDLDVDTTITIDDPGGPTWPATGIINISDLNQTMTNSLTYTNVSYSGGNIILTVPLGTGTNLYGIGDNVSMQAGQYTGYAIESVYGYDVALGTGGSNTALVDISPNFNSFPYGSIISLSFNEYSENFLNNYEDTLRYTGTPTGSSIGQGFQSEHGKGFGQYEGWYLCNGRVWQTYHQNNTSPSFEQEIPRCNNTSYEISTHTIPNIPDTSMYSVNGMDLEISKAAGASDISIVQSTLTDPLINAYIGDNNFAWLHWDDDRRDTNNKIFVVWLGRGDLYWYSNPPALVVAGKN